MALLKPLSPLHYMRLKFTRAKERVRREGLARYHKVRGWHGAENSMESEVYKHWKNPGQEQYFFQHPPDCWALFVCAILGHAYDFMPFTAAKCEGGLSTLNNSPLSFARKHFYMGDSISFALPT